MLRSGQEGSIGLLAPRDGASRMKKTGVDAPHRARRLHTSSVEKRLANRRAHGFLAIVTG